MGSPEPGPATAAAIAQRMDLPLVATGAVRFAGPEDAVAHKFLEAIRCGSRADGVLSRAKQQLAELVEQALATRFAETGRGGPSAQIRTRAHDEVRAICAGPREDYPSNDHGGV